MRVYQISTPKAPPCSCFSEVSTVHVQGKGITMMKDLQVNDQVLVQNKNRMPIYQAVYSFGHYNQQTPTEYLRIYTGNKEPLEISPGHLLYVQGKGHPVQAASIRVGDMLLQVSLDAATMPSIVTKINKVTRTGAYMPLTKDDLLWLMVSLPPLMFPSWSMLLQSLPNISPFLV